MVAWAGKFQPFEQWGVVVVSEEGKLHLFSHAWVQDESSTHKRSAGFVSYFFAMNLQENYFAIIAIFNFFYKFISLLGKTKSDFFRRREKELCEDPQ